MVGVGLVPDGAGEFQDPVIGMSGELQMLIASRLSFTNDIRQMRCIAEHQRYSLVTITCAATS
jgi:hypothetical protein